MSKEPKPPRKPARHLTAEQLIALSGWCVPRFGKFQATGQTSYEIADIATKELGFDVSHSSVKTVFKAHKAKLPRGHRPSSRANDPRLLEILLEDYQELCDELNRPMPPVLEAWLEGNGE